MECKKVRLCDSCKAGIWFEDTSVGIFGGWECDNPSVPEEFLDFELNIMLEDGNKHCPYHIPRVIESCGCCRKKINKPMWSWELWYNGCLGPTPCCSQECIDACDEQEEREGLFFSESL